MDWACEEESPTRSTAWRKFRSTFAGGMYLRGVWVTDLFGTGDGPVGAGEQGQVRINGGRFHFQFLRH